MPLNLARRYGSSERSYATAMIWLAIESCPQPLHKVEGTPL